MLQIVAHEIGHNLGMLHDFNGGNTNSQRYEGGQLCTNVGGIMDYRSNPYRWSACSVGDFTRYYNRVRNERPNDGYRPTYPFCLQAAEAATTTTTTTTTPETTTTIDASCIASCISSWTAADTPACVKTTLCTDSCAKGVCTQCDVIQKVAYVITAADDYSKEESAFQNFVLNIMLRSNFHLTYSVP